MFYSTNECEEAQIQFSQPPSHSLGPKKSTRLQRLAIHSVLVNYFRNWLTRAPNQNTIDPLKQQFGQKSSVALVKNSIHIALCKSRNEVLVNDDFDKKTELSSHILAMIEYRSTGCSKVASIDRIVLRFLKCSDIKFSTSPE